MSTTTWMLGAAALALGGGATMLALAWRQQRRDRAGQDDRFESLVRGRSASAPGSLRAERGGLRTWLVQLGGRDAVQQISTIDPEVPVLLRRAGLRGRESAAVYAAVQFLLPLVGGAAAAFGAHAAGSGREGVCGWAFAGFAVAFLAPKVLLRRRASDAQRRIQEELPTFARLLRILYDAGLGTEQALSVLSSEDCRAVPTVKREVEELLRLVRAGSSLAEATRHVAVDAGVPELSDLLDLLRHIDRYGGAVDGPLNRYVELLVDRRRTELQEKVSRLSAKMTVVMVTSLLPALLVFLAGPGFVSIIRALGGMRD